MPLQRCGEGGKGWQWGKSGKCYTGPGAKQKAIKQMRAIKSQESKSKHILDRMAEALKEKRE